MVRAPIGRVSNHEAPLGRGFGGADGARGNPYIPSHHGNR
jgi:hypothetical protein